MRASVAVTLALITFLTHTNAQDVNALAHPYVMQAAAIGFQVLAAEFSKHPERLHRISITFSFQLDRRGLPHRVRIVSKTRNPWAVDTAHRALSAAKFPPIPKKVVQAGTDLVNVQGDFDANAH